MGIHRCWITRKCRNRTSRANEVLVRVRACALNHLDLWVRRGIPGVPFPLPHIPGSDVAGEVVKIGSEVTTVRVSVKKWCWRRE